MHAVFMVHFYCKLQSNLITISDMGVTQSYIQLVATICHAVLLTWRVRRSVSSDYFSNVLTGIALTSHAEQYFV